MVRRKRRRGRGHGQGPDTTSGGPRNPAGHHDPAEPATAERPALVSWRERAREVLARLREHARETQGPALEASLRNRFGDEADGAPVADLETAFDDLICTPGTAGDPRSIVRQFAEEADDLEAHERTTLPLWETERRRRVYLLDRGHRDVLELWDPVRAERLTLHLLERLAPGRLMGLRRGAAVVATAAPLAARQVALGQVEIYDDDEAVHLYRKAVRDGGRTWHDLPPPAPV